MHVYRVHSMRRSFGEPQYSCSGYKNTDNHETAFTVTVDHVDTTTGVSPAERAYTIQKLLDPNAKAA